MIDIKMLENIGFIYNISLKEVHKYYLTNKGLL